MKYLIINECGRILSVHVRKVDALKYYIKNFAWECGVCGSSKRGLEICKHAEYGENRIICKDKIVTIFR